MSRCERKGYRGSLSMLIVAVVMVLMARASMTQDAMPSNRSQLVGQEAGQGERRARRNKQSGKSISKPPSTAGRKGGSRANGENRAGSVETEDKSHVAGKENAWKWIWAASNTRPPESVFFRHTFTLNRRPLAARLLITGEDSYVVYLNSTKQSVAEGNDWTTVREYDVSSSIKTGDNLLAIVCQNTSGRPGLIYKLVVQISPTKSVTLVSDERVKATRSAPLRWNSISLDGSTWKPARVVAEAGAAPWGPLRGAPAPDYSRLVRQWDLRAGGRPGEDPYSRQRNYGERMILSSNVASRSDMQILSASGFTLFQSDSDHLSTEEVARNQWDFQNANVARQNVQRMGLDWCYFPHQAFPPKWYRDSVPFTRIQCLEDNKSVEAFSIWDPTWGAFVDRGYDAIARNFSPQKGQKQIEALYVGIHGDYGEAGLLTGGRINTPTQREDWQRRFGDLHDHLGFWCADPLARQDFRKRMLAKYGDLEALNNAWHRHFKTATEIEYPPIPKGEPPIDERRMWLDFVGWYDESVGRAIDANLKAARSRFPDTLLMLPAGFGDENVRGGNDNSMIAKLAAKYHAAVRSTHGHLRPFAENAVSMLGRLGSASRFYGAPFWIEPSTSLTANEEVERIFEAVSQGATGYFDWSNNIIANRDVYYRYGKFLRVEKPIVDVAMFYPAAAQRLKVDQPINSTFVRATSYLRDIGNFDIVDDRMVLDDCLQNYRVLVLWEGTVCDPATLDKIKAWVNDGGVLLAYDFNKVRTFDGDTSWFQEMFGYYKDLVPARVTERYEGSVPPQYRLMATSAETSDYLGDGWYEGDSFTDSSGVAVGGRWTQEKASLRLPIQPDKWYTLVVRAYLPPEAVDLKHQVLINGRRDMVRLGDISAAGEVTYRYLIPRDLTAGRSLATITFQSETIPENRINANSSAKRALGVRILSAQMVEQNTPEDTAALPLPGRFVRELDMRFLNPRYEKPEQSWVRLYGKGLTVFFPANKSLLKGYIEVVRQVMTHLSSIDSNRKDALPVDDAQDGVYATLFQDKILYYNPKDTAVTKSINIPKEAFEAWKDTVLTPARGLNRKIKIPPHEIVAVYLDSPPDELVFECEGFTILGGLKTVASADCSPGVGQTCVRIPAGSAIVTKFDIDAPGKYKIFTRCLRGTKLEQVDVLLDGVPITTSERVESGQTLFQGSVTLTKEAHTLVLRARDKDVRADFVLFSNDSTVAGYDFATRTVPLE